MSTTFSVCLRAKELTRRNNPIVYPLSVKPCRPISQSFDQPFVSAWLLTVFDCPQQHIHSRPPCVKTRTLAYPDANLDALSFFAPAGCFGCLFDPATVSAKLRLSNSLFPPRETVHNVSQNDRIQDTTSCRETSITMGKRGMKRRGNEFIVAFILSASTPHALPCHSYSACRRSHFVRSSRVSLITCLFLLAVNCLFTFLATRMFAMCLSLSSPDSRWACVLLSRSLIIVLQLTLCCFLILMSQRSLRIELG